MRCEACGGKGTAPKQIAFGLFVADEGELVMEKCRACWGRGEIAERMVHSAKILADSISPDGVRLTSIECVYPRIIHAEIMTHRVFSRNAASSRAVPVAKMMKMVEENPYIPTHWGKNQKGMQAEQEFPVEEQDRLVEDWLRARDKMLMSAQCLLTAGVHKQITNRLLEPWLWYTCIITATEWSNFFHLRCHKDAHPEIRRIAELMRDAMAASEPKQLKYGQWHLPFIDPITENVDDQWNYWCKVSVGRCARVSYLTHDGKRDPQADIELADRLLEAGHMSPFEHVARPLASGREAFLRSGNENSADCFVGNLRGWVQFRKTILGESDILEKK